MTLLTKELILGELGHTAVPFTHRWPARALELLRQYLHVPTTITVCAESKHIRVSYPGDKFGIQELSAVAKEPTLFNGNGAHVLLQAQDIIRTYYTTGINTWEIDTDTMLAPVSCEFDINNVFNVAAVYEQLLRPQIFGVSAAEYEKILDVLPLLDEILTNIFWHVNVIPVEVDNNSTE